MKDCNGKRLVAGHLIRCINDVDYGKEYLVEAYGGTLLVRENKNDDTPLPLSSFENENGCLIDFEWIPCRKNGYIKASKAVAMLGQQLAQEKRTVWSIVEKDLGYPKGSGAVLTQREFFRLYELAKEID